MSDSPGLAPQLGASYYPGGFDDYYMPELISPSPQRYVNVFRCVACTIWVRAGLLLLMVVSQHNARSAIEYARRNCAP
jgi:hypothetical protein